MQATDHRSVTLVDFVEDERVQARGVYYEHWKASDHSRLLGRAGSDDAVMRAYMGALSINWRCGSGCSKQSEEADRGEESIVDSDQTIRDFGAQWLRHPENDGYYASVEMFRDICGPLLQPSDVEGRRVADLGSGSGRIVEMLLDCGAAHVTAVEPSDAIHVLRENTSGRADRITYVHGTADCLPPGDYDVVVSIGVLHHVPEPGPAVARALEMLKPGGRLLVWLYGREGNEIYLAFAGPLRRVTSRIPDGLLRALCRGLVPLLSGYAWLCRWIPLPMRGYMRSVITPLRWRHRSLVIFDQLNPAYAKYYSERKARALIQDAGFSDVEIYHRHGYSWTVSGRKPATIDQTARQRRP